jgi:hypothetical protein
MRLVDDNYISKLEEELATVKHALRDSIKEILKLQRRLSLIEGSNNAVQNMPAEVQGNNRIS